MNHIYKVIRCRATGMLVAVAEFAKAQGKSSNTTVGQVATIDNPSKIQALKPSANKLFTLTAIMGGLMMSNGAWAEPYYSVNDGGVIRNNYNNDGAEGIHSLAAGVGAKVGNDGLGATAIGYEAAASKEAAIALGTSAIANGKAATALGQAALATDDASTAIGRQAQATVGEATAVGSNAKAIANSATAVGVSAVADGIHAVALGGNSYAVGEQAIAIGRDSQASTYGLAAGSKAQASNNAIALGTLSNAAARQAVAIGYNSNAIDYGLAAGSFANAGNNAVALGTQSNASAFSTAIGRDAKATGGTSVAIGRNAQATGDKSISIGHGNIVSGNNSGAIGDPSTISGNGSYSLGNNNTVTTDNTFVVGNNVTQTVANSVGLGANSAMTAGSAAGTANLTLTGTAGATTTAGDTGTVSNATLNNITYGNFAGATANGVVSVGASGAERRVQNVAAGEISATSTDAINGSQLHATNAVIGNVANSTTTVLGGNAAVTPDGTITMTNIGGTGENTVHDAIQAINTVANAGWNLQTNGDTASNVAPNGTVQFLDGKNIKITRTGTDVTVATADDVNFNTVTATTSITAGTGANQVVLNNSGVNVGGNTYISSTGLNANNQVISNVAAGTADTDAVNVGQLKDVVASSEKTSSVVAGTNVSVTSATTGNNTEYTVNADGATVSAGSTAVTVTAGAKDANNVTDYSVDLSDATKASLAKADTAVQKITSNDANLTVTRTGNDVALDFSDDPTFNSVKIGDATNNTTLTSTANGLDVGGDKITNVAAGTADTDAVNVSQLTAVKAAATTKVDGDQGVTVTPTTNADGSTTYKVAAKTDGKTVGVNADGEIAAVTSAINTSMTGTSTAVTPTALATSGEVAKAINNSGFTLTAQGANGSLVKPGSTVDMNNTDGNILISKAANNNTVTYNLNPNLTLESVTAGTGANQVVLNNSGVNVGGKTYISDAGLNANNKVISNVADGVNPNDAVNVSQLNRITNNFGYRINDVEDNANAGISSAMATAALPQAYLPGKSMVAGGMASYNGESALAIGMSTLSDNGRWAIKINGTADSQGNVGGAVGAGFHW